MIDGDLSRLFRENLPGFHFQRIETGGTGRGVPDTNYAVSGLEGWLEWKTTDGWVLGLRPEQLGWVSRRARLGCRVWVAVRRKAAAGKRRGEACDELWLVPGAAAIFVQEHGLKGMDGCAAWGVRMWRGGPRRWDWGAVRELLVG